MHAAKRCRLKVRLFCQLLIKHEEQQLKWALARYHTASLSGITPVGMEFPEMALVLVELPGKSRKAKRKAVSNLASLCSIWHLLIQITRDARKGCGSLSCVNSCLAKGGNPRSRQLFPDRHRIQTCLVSAALIL